MQVVLSHNEIQHTVAAEAEHTHTCICVCVCVLVCLTELAICHLGLAAGYELFASLRIGPAASQQDVNIFIESELVSSSTLTF